MPYNTLPFAFSRVLSIAVIERSTMPSKTNRYFIVDILCFMSVVEMVFSLLSNVRLLHGMDNRPHASAISGYTGNLICEKYYAMRYWNLV